MRGLNRTWTSRAKEENGVIAPVTALLMVALLGMAAFAIDTAMLYSEHAQLQNGADASALAIAESCAGGLHLATCQKDLANANALAGANAVDGFTEVVSSKVKTGTTGGTVDVEVQSLSADSKKHFSLVFARVLGLETVDMRTYAQASFSGYSRAHVLPLAFSQCESDPGLTKGLQFFPAHGNATKSLCSSKASGLEIPGGFGWLRHDVLNGSCYLQIVVSSDYKSDVGGIPADCKPTFDGFKSSLQADKTVEVLVPIYNKVSGTGADAMFHIEAFAQISLRGWHFNGETYLTTDATAKRDSLKLNAADYGLFATYIKKVSLAEAAVLGGPATYRAFGIRLTN